MFKKPLPKLKKLPRHWAILKVEARSLFLSWERYESLWANSKCKAKSWAPSGSKSPRKVELTSFPGFLVETDNSKKYRNWERPCGRGGFIFYFVIIFMKPMQTFDWFYRREGSDAKKIISYSGLPLGHKNFFMDTITLPLYMKKGFSLSLPPPFPKAF